MSISPHSTQTSHSNTAPLSSVPNTDGAGATATSLDDQEAGADAPVRASVLSLVARGGEVVPVTRKAARLSRLVRVALDGDEETDQLPLPSAGHAALQLAVRWMERHAGCRLPDIPKPLPTPNLYEYVPTWDAEFIALDQSTLFDLTLVANYMEITDLLNLCAAKIASLCMDKTPEQIRQTFDLPDDLTPGEKRLIERESRHLLQLDASMEGLRDDDHHSEGSGDESESDDGAGQRAMEDERDGPRGYPGDDD